jgi:hypothetical protein
VGRKKTMWYLGLLFLSVAVNCESYHIKDWKNGFTSWVRDGRLSHEKISFFQDTGHGSESNAMLIESLKQEGWYLTIENVTVRKFFYRHYNERPIECTKWEPVLCYGFKIMSQWYYQKNVTSPFSLCIVADDVREDLVPLLDEPDKTSCLKRGRGWISVISFNPLLSNNTAKVLSVRKEWDEIMVSDHAWGEYYITFKD